jgi:pimeloyl-ACP methyl ester carboxylesterase
VTELRTVAANGLEFTCRIEGATGEPVILLHGFPETSHMWTDLLPRLAEAGYRCVAPDQRGYSPGARPLEPRAYGYAHIAADVFALADAFGFDRFHLVGHDWGAAAGWSALTIDPARIASWTAMSVPHITAFGRAIREDPDQRSRSSYIGYFQQPGAAEAALAADDFSRLRALWSESHTAQIEAYLHVFRQPGALTAALNWYRASRGVDPADTEVIFGPVATPSMLIWGNEDRAIGRTAVCNGAGFMTGPYRFVELDGGHWLAQQFPDRVAEELLGFLAANRMS